MAQKDKITELLERQKFEKTEVKPSVKEDTLRKVDLIDAVKEFNVLDKSAGARLYQNMRCPKNCEGRIINKGNCTADNCVVIGKRMSKSKIGIAAVKIASKTARPARVRKLGYVDKKLLDKVTTYKTTTSGFHWRNHERPEIKEQLESLGRKMPRLAPRPRITLSKVNKVRAQLGLLPLEKLGK